MLSASEIAESCLKLHNPDLDIGVNHGPISNHLHDTGTAAGAE